jgi:RimJ/RimL family protein N-acetyltransferase
MRDIKIKQLYEHDWQFAKSIRLLALQQNADVFLSSYEEEAQYSESVWRHQLKISDGATFGLFDGNQIIGITGVFTWKGDSSGKTAILAMSFIDAAYRGRGYSKLFYDARIEWVKQQGGFDKIRVSHRAGNHASRTANQNFGFQLIDKEMITWPDGTKGFEHNYTLQI